MRVAKQDSKFTTPAVKMSMKTPQSKSGQKQRYKQQADGEIVPIPKVSPPSRNSTADRRRKMDAKIAGGYVIVPLSGKKPYVEKDPKLLLRSPFYKPPISPLPVTPPSTLPSPVRAQPAQTQVKRTESTAQMPRVPLLPLATRIEDLTAKELMDHGPVTWHREGARAKDISDENLENWARLKRRHLNTHAQPLITKILSGANDKRRPRKIASRVVLATAVESPVGPVDGPVDDKTAGELALPASILPQAGKRVINSLADVTDSEFMQFLPFEFRAGTMERYKKGGDLPGFIRLLRNQKSRNKDFLQNYQTQLGQGISHRGQDQSGLGVAHINDYSMSHLVRKRPLTDLYAYDDCQHHISDGFQFNQHLTKRSRHF